MSGNSDESTKNILIMKGRSSCQTVNDILKDINLLSKPHCKMLSKTNDILPFEDVNSIEFLCGKNDSSLFMIGSHTKKRPNNLVMVCLQ
jgi:ribosome production factor 2